MTKKIIFFIGIIIFISGIVLLVKLQKDANLAIKQDDEKIVYGSVSGDIVPCSWEVQPPERVMSENKSQALVIQVSSFDDTGCESVISLRAPGFDMSPGKEEQSITLPQNKKGSLSWILIPRKSGTFEIATSDIINTKIFGITVTNVFGLNAFQAKIASLIGSIFGPMLTFPWWWDKWRQRKANSNGKIQ